MANFLSNRKKIGLYDKIREIIRKNKPDELRKLLSKKEAKEHIRKHQGKELFYLLIDAIYFGRFECIQDLLKAGAYPCIADECDPLMIAVVYGEDLRILKLLLDCGAKLDLADAEMRPHKQLLYIAASRADLGCFRMLLLYGADPDYNCSHRDFTNSTADDISVLGMCLQENYEAPFVKLLIQFGANMYLPDIQKILNQVDNDATKLLEQERAHPRSLMSQCRIAIRRLLKEAGKLCVIDQLEIPNKLVKYLQYHNELDEPEKLPRHAKESPRPCYLIF